MCFATNSIVMAGVTVHIIPLMMERGFSMVVIISTIALIGPMQVMGRVVVTIFETWLSFRRAGLVSCVLLLCSFALLFFALPSNYLNYFFPIFYGSSLGIITIVRALAVPELIGSEAYGALNGLLGLVSSFALALTPVLISWVWLLTESYTAPLWLFLIMAFLSLIGFVLAIKKARK